MLMLLGSHSIFPSTLSLLHGSVNCTMQHPARVVIMTPGDPAEPGRAALRAGTGSNFKLLNQTEVRHSKKSLVVAFSFRSVEGVVPLP